MAFVTDGSGNVISYAESEDIYTIDQRVFEANEIDFVDVPDSPGSLDNYLDDLCIKTTDRINAKIRASARWREYMDYTGIGYEMGNIPDFNPNLILTNQQDFTDMCAFGALYMYVLPKIADFGNPESPEVQKISFYEVKFNDMFTELTSMWDFYDKNADGTIETGEKMIRFQSTRRTRGRRNIVKVS